jgi:DNA phosphorothioation-dependent restriction protein DptG
MRKPLRQKAVQKYLLHFKSHCTQKSVENKLCPTAFPQILISQIAIPASLKENEMKHK